MPTLRPTLAAALATHHHRRRLEAAVRLVGGGALSLAGARVLADGSLGAAGLVALVGLGVTAWTTLRHWRAGGRTPDDLVRAVDTTGHTADLITTAWCIETDRSRGSDALGDAILAEAHTRLPELLPAAEVPLRVPRAGVVSLLVAVALLFVPRAAPPPDAPAPVVDETWTDDTPAHVDPTHPSPPGPSPEAPATAASPPSATTDRAQSSGADQRSSGGAETTDADGISGGAGDRAADGDLAATEADGDATSGAGASDGVAREAGTSGASGTDTTPAPQGGPRSGTGPSVDVADDAPIAEEDGNTTGMVGQTAAETDAVRSDAETMHLEAGTPDDRDAQTRDVAGTLDLNSSAPRFFDATETEDAEQDGKGGAGGWTIGLSQPGEGGVNDASGSTWRTEAGIEDPPDWTDAPSEWVDAAWQDSPAGVVRRVKNGQAGGAGSTDYAEAWHRYAAVAESDSTRPTVPPGRLELVRQYFIAIAPTEP